MKVLFLNTFEKTGGAAIACLRLMNALNANGVQTKLLVLDKQTDDANVYTVNTNCWKKLLNQWRFVWERLFIFVNSHIKRKDLFRVSIANTGTDISRHPLVQEADIIHLHWINCGFLSVKDIEKLTRLGKPIVWTMHDMWSCTGICHHSYTCLKFQTSCAECPFLNSKKEKDLSQSVFMEKKQRLQLPTLHYVAVSNWLADMAKRSSITSNHNITVIPNVISLSQMTPLDRAEARVKLSVYESYLIAFGAVRIDNEIKGFKYLAEAVRILTEEYHYQPEQIRLLLFGGIHNKEILDIISVPYSYYGFIADKTMLSTIYSAANVVVSSSLYETFGQTLIEAQLCGSVPVSFDNSGQTDIILHKQNGYLAKYLSSTDLAVGIDWGFHSNISAAELRKYVKNTFGEVVVAQQYKDLYQKLIENNIK